jgi:hypothetical protein
MTRLRALVAGAFAFGAIVPVIAGRVELVGFWAPAFCAFVFGALAGWKVPGRIGESSISVAVGIIVGLSLDAAIDFVYRGRDRNLIGVEWIFWIVILAIPLALGYWLLRATPSHRCALASARQNRDVKAHRRLPPNCTGGRVARQFSRLLIPAALVSPVYVQPHAAQRVDTAGLGEQCVVLLLSSLAVRSTITASAF